MIRFIHAVACKILKDANTYQTKKERLKNMITRFIMEFQAVLSLLKLCYDMKTIMFIELH